MNLAMLLLERAGKRREVGLITAAELDRVRAAYDKLYNEVNLARRDSDYERRE